MTKVNLLPYDGEVFYFTNFISDQINSYRTSLLNEIDWENERILMFGKEMTTKRKVAFHGDAGLNYTYSNTKKIAKKWSPTLLAIKNKIEQFTGDTFNACLLNLYHNGDEGMGWHRDNEKEIIKFSTIASYSIGAKRRFSFKHKTSKETIHLELENNSLLLMTGATQENWHHQLPKTKKVNDLRINLTFRKMKL